MPDIHYVTLTPKTHLDGTELPSDLKFECRGDSSSDCHIYPACDCEYWDDDHAKEHPRVPHDECWLQGWFDNDATSYEGDDFNDMDDCGVPCGVSRSGPIKTSFEVDYVGWEFEGVSE